MANEILTLTVEVDTATGQAKLAQFGGQVEKTAAQTTAATGKIEKGFSDLEKALATVGIGFGVAALVTFLKSAYVEAARTERAFNGLATQIAAIGGSSGAARKFINALAEQANVLDDDLVPAYERLFRATNNTADAERLLELATRFANNGIGTIQGNAERLALAFQTKTTRSLREFGVIVRESDGDLVAFADAMSQVERKGETLGLRIHDMQDRVQSLASRWDHLKDTSASWIEEMIRGLERFPELVNAVAGQGVSDLDERIRKLREATRTEAIQNPLFIKPGQPLLSRDAALDIIRLEDQEAAHAAALGRIDRELTAQHEAEAAALKALTDEIEKQVDARAKEISKDREALAQKRADAALTEYIYNIELATERATQARLAAQARGMTIPKIGSLSPTALGAAPAVNVNLDALNAQAKAWAELQIKSSAYADALARVAAALGAVEQAGGTVSPSLRKQADDFLAVAKTVDALGAATTVLAGLQNAYAIYASAASERTREQQVHDRQIYAAIQALIETAEAYKSFASYDYPGGVAHTLAAAAFAYAAGTASTGTSNSRGTAARGEKQQTGPTSRTTYGAQRSGNVYNITAWDAKSLEQSLHDGRRSRAIDRALARRARRRM